MTTPNREDWKEEFEKLIKSYKNLPIMNVEVWQIEDFISSLLSQTEQRIYKEMMEEIGEVGGNFTGFENDAQWGVKKGVADERQRFIKIITKKLNKDI